MTLKIGRVSLTTPLEIDVIQDTEYETYRGPTGSSTPSEVSVDQPSYRLRGREQGASAQATMDSFITEMKRRGAVYVLEDSATALIPEGYYVKTSPRYTKPGGRPKGRPWELQLKFTPLPWITRQAEDDEVAGTPTADVTADEGNKIVYTAPVSETIVLDPRNVAGAEKVNLPAGDWKVMARVQSRTTTTQKFRAKLADLTGAAIATGAQVTVTTANTWTDLDLGTLTVPAANDKANWFELYVQRNADANDVWIDRVWLIPA